MSDEYDTARWVQENRDPFVIQARIMKLLIERDEARAENERLRAALKPFAIDDPAWIGPDSLHIEMRAVDDEPQPCVTLADIRRAKAALERKPE